MNETTINVIITAILAPLVLLIAQQWYHCRKNKVDYGDDLLDTMNKTAASLKEARTEIATLETELRQADEKHEEDMQAIKRGWDERQARLKARIADLEKVIVKYDISFTLVTHPQVQVTDLKVVGKEDVMASQKLQAIRGQERKAGKP